jgi:hypothetical protein
MDNPISPKVSAAALAAAVATIIVWLVSMTGLAVPVPVEGAFVVLLTFGAGYLVEDPLRTPSQARHRAE